MDRQKLIESVTEYVSLHRMVFYVLVIFALLCIEKLMLLDREQMHVKIRDGCPH